ncbi:MAG: desulfoferrodoxin family protein [Alphaproteobacteria bacterium]
MKYERKFYKCNICGHVTEETVRAGGPLACCNHPMELLKVNTVDASQEKHVPAVKIENGKLKVQVGSVEHPMTAEHHIAFIVVAEKNKTTRIDLDINSKPEAEFEIPEGGVTVYEYCNLHGLWAVDFEK